MGELILVASPIGNLGDLSVRAISVLQRTDFWIVEDTRVSGKLQAHLGISKPMRVCNEHTAIRQIQAYVSELEAGKSAALLTDAGSPAVSDPGALITDLCYERGIGVDSVPGPSAVTDALALSGFFAQRFAFLGFLPRKPGPMAEEFAPFADSPYTLAVFESPHRLNNLLGTAARVLGVRRYAVCREMTKTHQQVWRNSLPNLPSPSDIPPKGEVCVVFEGKRKTKNAD